MATMNFVTLPPWVHNMAALFRAMAELQLRQEDIIDSYIQSKTTNQCNVIIEKNIPHHYKTFG